MSRRSLINALIVFAGLAAAAGIAYRIRSAKSLPAGAQKQPGEQQFMSRIEELKFQLADMIIRGKGYEAEKIAKALGNDAAPALMQLTGHRSSEVRRCALEVAGQTRDVGSCRVIIKSLEDPDPEIRDLATVLLGTCAHRQSLPDLLAAMKEHPDPRVRRSLALRIGALGAPSEIETLRRYQSAASDPALRHSIELALARLGHPNARDAVVKRLQNQDAGTRYGALQDCVYIQDKSLVAHFGPALADSREVVQLTIPEEGPAVHARMCDAAVMVMANLGYKLSFPAEMLERRSQRELEEARKIVFALHGK